VERDEGVDRRLYLIVKIRRFKKRDVALHSAGRAGQRTAV